MTDQSEDKGPKLPPKIKLNLNGAGSPPAPANAAANPDDSAPKQTDAAKSADADSSSPGGMIKLNMDEALKAVEQQVAPAEKSSAAAEPPERPKIKLGLGNVDTEPKADAAAADSANVPPAEKPAEKQDSPPAEPAKKPGLTLKTKPAAAEADVPAAPPEKSIQLKDIEGESLDDLYQAALNATQRVILDEKEKAATSKIQTDEAQALKKAEIAEASKKSTARLDLGEMLSDDERKDIMKSETMHIGSDSGEPAKPKPSGTMKIQRPDDANAKAESTMAIPLDSAISKGESTMAIPLDGADAKAESTMAIPLDSLEESKKSETARIELPREVAASKPPSGRKTIRIKRPDGSGAAPRPALNVARSSTPSTAPQTAATEAAQAAISFDSSDDEVDSPAFAAIALVAVLVGFALVYVLAATLVPALPFPGRLV